MVDAEKPRSGNGNGLLRTKGACAPVFLSIPAKESMARPNRRTQPPARKRVFQRNRPKADTKHFTHNSSKSRIYGFAFQRQHTEHALVNPVQRFAFDKPMKCLMAQRVLA